MANTINTEVNTNTDIDTNVSTNVGTDANTDTNTNTNTDSTVTTDVTTNTEVDNKTDNHVKPEIMIPKERFDEVNNKFKTLSAEFEQMKQQREQYEAQLQELKQTNEANTNSFNADTEKLKGQVQHYQTLVTELVEQKMSIVPEDMKELIPEGLSVEQKLSWLNKAESKGLFTPKVKHVQIGEPLNHSSEQDKKERMKKMNPLQLMASYYGGSN